MAVLTEKEERVCKSVTGLLGVISSAIIRLPLATSPHLYLSQTHSLFWETWGENSRKCATPSIIANNKICCGICSTFRLNMHLFWDNKTIWISKLEYEVGFWGIWSLISIYFRTVNLNVWIGICARSHTWGAGEVIYGGYQVLFRQSKPSRML